MPLAARMPTTAAPARMRPPPATRAMAPRLDLPEEAFWSGATGAMVGTMVGAGVGMGAVVGAGVGAGVGTGVGAGVGAGVAVGLVVGMGVLTG